ncbi:hypothetical protein [Streptomyces sp. CB01201]|uniref:hypothetical protein n=1 Tax=Streptomyces sp. CB01201 TaxID=2020324 RepID=UPI00131E8092|nr:hypothetical protein [Streptomyces sp. CB01201]
MFGRSKSSGESGGPARAVKNDEKTTSSDVRSWTPRRDWHSPSGKYETRCDADGYSLKGLPRRKDAEAFAEIHNAERHGH